MIDKIPTFIIPFCLGFIINRGLRKDDIALVLIGVIAFVANLIFVVTR